MLAPIAVGSLLVILTVMIHGGGTSLWAQSLVRK